MSRLNHPFYCMAATLAMLASGRAVRAGTRTAAWQLCGPNGVAPGSSPTLRTAMNVASRVSVPACILIGAFLLPASAPHAATYIAGTGNGCTHATVQAAIDAAQTNPGPDTVRVTRTQAWNAQEVVINTNQELTVTGGFDACGTSAPSGMTTLSGAGGNARQVFRITLPTGGLVRLQHLMIRDADPASD